MNHNLTVTLSLHRQQTAERMTTARQYMAAADTGVGQTMRRLLSILTQFTSRQQSRLTRHPSRVAALKHACSIMSRRHCQWADLCFDEHFLQYRGAQLLEPFLQGGAAPTPRAMTEAWSSQFFYTAERGAAAEAYMRPLAEEFVSLLQHEQSRKQ